MTAHIRRILTRLGVLSSRPAAFLIVVVYGGARIILSPQTLNWQGVVALFVWMMTIFIQRAEHRDTQAIHAKLDHLLAVVEKADTGFSGVDRMQPEEIEKLREDGPV